jgi:hypothetical protein
MLLFAAFQARTATPPPDFAQRLPHSEREDHSV